MKPRYNRRNFLNALTLAAGPLMVPDASYIHMYRMGRGKADVPATFRQDPMSDIRQIEAGELSVGYAELGSKDGSPVILLHGWPYDIHSYEAVAPLLASRGCRVIVPHLRGHGSTRFIYEATHRSGQQAAIGNDVIALMDALKIPRAVLAGYDWGGRAACVVAALWPERCAGLVSVNGYLIQDISKAARPLAAKTEAGFWYQYYFLTERGHAGLTANRREIARLMWTRNSPEWKFDDAVFNRSATAFDNPDYVDITIHSYRHRLGFAPGSPPYDDLERRLAAQPVITVPTITLDGGSDGVVPATDGKLAAGRFSGERQHRIIPHAGHNLPQENPRAFAAAVWELASRHR
ncbi:alpha/beta fold hydrolase [Dyadobacter sp. OTU695]|uniref:alpha/beta fold hydrolase n=1 Tax=Dyadobacter sp. OTU695 TaxID=3043860 RepID=UPI00313ABDDB